MAVIIRSVTSVDDLGDVFDAAGAPFDPPIDRSDEHRIASLRAACEGGERDLLLFAESDTGFVGAVALRLSSCPDWGPQSVST